MPEPVREQIQSAVAARLAGILSTDGYYTTPAVVTRRLLPIDAYNEFPVVGIGPSDESLLTLQAQKEAYLDEFSFRTWGYVKGDDAVPPYTWLERLWDDVVRRILAQPGLGGLCQIVRPTRLQVDVGLADPFAAFVQSWQAQLIQPFRVSV
jgi:hypothetical protein